MYVMRQDSWTNDHDQVLANTILNHIRCGSTQLKAFEEVADVLGRTPAACGFRWNSEVRKQYAEEIAKAKQERMNKTSVKVPVHLVEREDKVITIYDKIISLLQEAKENHLSLRKEYDALKKQIEQQSNEIEELKRMKSNDHESDLQHFMNILKRARELGVLDRTS